MNDCSILNALYLPFHVRIVRTLLLFNSNELLQAQTFQNPRIERIKQWIVQFELYETWGISTELRNHVPAQKTVLGILGLIQLGLIPRNKLIPRDAHKPPWIWWVRSCATWAHRPTSHLQPNKTALNSYQMALKFK